MATGNSHPDPTRLEAVVRRIETACREAGRSSATVTLIAVAKGRPAAAINALARQGQNHFGESYLQEALNKRNQVTVPELQWHFIGPIQSNKTRDIAERFDWVHSVDRLKILKRLDQQRPSELAPLDICLQVNISDETAKSGVTIQDLPALADAASDCARLKLRGLMAIPAQTSIPVEQRAAFARLRELFEHLNAGGFELDTLSMGMSADLEAAILEGATMVRVGTALFESGKQR